MPSYRLLMEYDGTAYVGWQRQPVGVSIQGVLERAVASVMGVDRVSVLASGRTDAGVHALGQVASFDTPVHREAANLLRGVNSLLPDDVSLLEAGRVSDGFNARYHARSKTYRYRILDCDRRSAQRQRFVQRERSQLDTEAMAEAARLLLGRHDYSSFRAVGSSVPTSVRTISRVELCRRMDEVHVEIDGDGFLRHMVRIVVGSLLEVGRGRRPPTWLGDVLAARDRAAAGRTAPARGLHLVRVEYAGADAPWQEPGLGD